MTQSNYCEGYVFQEKEYELASSYKLFYETDKKSHKIYETFEHNLTKWHKKKYRFEPEYCVEYPANNSYDATIKYITQFVELIIIIKSETFVVSGIEVDGYSVNITLKKTHGYETNKDYKQLLNVIKTSNEEIIKDNKLINDEENEHHRELCNIERAKNRH